MSGYKAPAAGLARHVVDIVVRGWECFNEVNNLVSVNTLFSVVTHASSRDG